jgi:hypothetical protein
LRFDYRVEGNIIVFTGVLDEKVSKQDLLGSLSAVNGITGLQEVALDFSGVKSGNSMGIRSLYQFLSELDCIVDFHKVPAWLMEQFGMIKNMVKADWKISSVCLPYYNSENDSDRLEVLRVGIEIPVLDSYEDFESENILIDGLEYEPDYDAESVLNILSYQ